MTQIELQAILGEQITAVNNLDTKSTAKESQVILAKADQIARLAKQMINNADVVLRADKLCNSHERIDKVVGS